MSLYEKKYKDAQKWIESIYTELTHERQMEAEAFFPELKEREDERIKKQILSFLKDFERDHYRNLDFSSWIAWLEKQGKHEDEENTDFTIYYPLKNGKGKYESIPYSFYGTLTSFSENIDLINFLRNCFYSEEECEEWIKHQCETISWKPTKEQYEALDYAYNSCSDTETGNYYKGVLETLIEDLHNLEKQGSQILANSAKTCKVEPKFKVGDWVVDNLGKVGQISSVTDDGYGFLLYDGTYISGCWKDYYHRWTIQDAKDGEVIAWDNSNCIALFKNIYDKESFHSHGFVGHITGEFVSEISYHDIAGAHPATKEQRNLFFQKMKESGYEWDAEKRELKRIEQNNNEESNERNCEMNGLYYAKTILEKTLGKVEGYQTDDGILEHKSAINVVTKLCEHKNKIE